MKLYNKICVVTGAGQGMGRAIVQHLVEQGAIVYAVDDNAETLNETVKNLAQVTVVAVARIPQGVTGNAHGIYPVLVRRAAAF